MKEITFNRNPIRLGKSILPPSQDLIQATPGLFRATLDDAFLYGGELTRAALSVINLHHDRTSIVVDVKVHMLMPGFQPAIPGWHTDGVPRPKGLADIFEQEKHRPTRYHLIVTGSGCLTQFLRTPSVPISVPDEPGPDLHRCIGEEVVALLKDAGETEILTAPSCQVVMWDWWNIHRGPVAQKREWRYLIRVAETDWEKPHTDLRKVLRTQQQVYAPMEFGW